MSDPIDSVYQVTDHHDWNGAVGRCIEFTENGFGLRWLRLEIPLGKGVKTISPILREAEVTLIPRLRKKDPKANHDLLERMIDS
jgi:hypothetical protein